MIKFKRFLPQRIGKVMATTLFFWCNVLDGVGLSQILPLGELNKLPKPCFAENAELPAPPLSQTQLSTPSLWLESDIYGDVVQQNTHPAVGNVRVVETIDTEAEEQIEAQLEKYKPKKQLPTDVILPDNQLLETWFVENQDFVQLSPTLTVNNLVTLVVNRQTWQAERYIGQYVFMNRFGTTAREYGYNLRVCNNQGSFLGYYVCDFQTDPLNCQVMLRSEGFRLRDFRVFEVLPLQ